MGLLSGHFVECRLCDTYVRSRISSVICQKTLILGAKLLERIHILKHKEERLDKIERSMNHYHEAAEFMSSHWG